MLNRLGHIILRFLFERRNIVCEAKHGVRVGHGSFIDLVELVCAQHLLESLHGRRYR